MRQSIFTLGLVLVLGLSACQKKVKETFKYNGEVDSINISKESYTIKAQFPKYNHRYTDSLIQAEIEKKIKIFKTSVGEQEGAEEWKSEQVISCETEYTDFGIFSIVFRDYHYTGGAHGNTFLSSIVLNPDMQEKYGLQDFFATSAMSAIQEPVRVQLKQQLESDVFIEEGTATLSDFSVFTISNETLNVYFPPYQVAAYAFGTPVVKLNTKTLKGFKQP